MRGAVLDRSLYIVHFFCMQLHIAFVEAKDVIVLEGPPAEVQQAEALLATSIHELVRMQKFLCSSL